MQCADTHRDLMRLGLDLDWLCQGIEHILGCLIRQVRLRPVDDELIAADSSDDRRCRQRFAKACRECFQHLVTGPMAELVVDRLEVVEIKVRIDAPETRGEVVLESLEKRASVQQARQLAPSTSAMNTAKTNEAMAKRGHGDCVAKPGTTSDRNPIAHAYITARFGTLSATNPNPQVSTSPKTTRWAPRSGSNGIHATNPMLAPETKLTAAALGTDGNRPDA